MVAMVGGWRLIAMIAMIAMIYSGMIVMVRL
jgi:hypothetical protein